MLSLIFDKRSIQLYLCFTIFFFLSNIFFINFLAPISIIDINIVDLNFFFFKISIIFFLIIFSTFFIKERLEYEVRILNVKKIYNLFIFIILIAISFNFFKIFNLLNEIPKTLSYSYYCIPSLIRNIWLKSNFSGIYKLTSIMAFLLSNFVFFILFFLYFFKKYFSRKKQILIYILMGILIVSFFFSNFSRQFLINFFTFYLCIIVIDICFTKKKQFLIKDFLLLIFSLFLFFLVSYVNVKCMTKTSDKLFTNTQNEIIYNLEDKHKKMEIKNQIYNFRILENNEKEKKLLNYFSESTKFSFYYIYTSIDNSKILLNLNKNNNNQKLHTYYIKQLFFSDFDFIKKIDMSNNYHEYFNYKVPGSVGYLVLAYNDYDIFFYLILIIIFFLIFLFLKKLLKKNFFLLGFVLILILYYSIQSVLFNTPFSFNFRHFTFIFIVFSLFLSKNLKLLRCS